MPDLSLLNILLMVIIFIISLAIVIVIPKIKAIEKSTVKTMVYIGLGLVAFTLVGVSFNLWQDPQVSDILDASKIVGPYIQFYPTLILALALAATVLITYVERENYAFYFAGTGFAVLLPDIYQYVFSDGRIDLALLGCALWAVIPVVWAFMWRDNSLIETTMGEKIVTSLKAAFLTYPVYLLTALIAIFGESQRGLNTGSLTSISNSIPNIIMFILVTIWLFYLVNIIIVSLMFVIHDLVLHLFSYRRVSNMKGVRYEKIVLASAKAAAPPKPKVNHYAGLIGEMQLFGKHIGDVDRIRAASTIGRFKSEYQTLAAKYNEDSKGEAEKMIKLIEQEFMQKY